MPNPRRPGREGSAPLTVIFLNRFFYPDHSATSQILTDLAFALAAQGIGVTVIASRQLYDAPEVGLPARESVNGVDIHRVWTSRFGRQNLVGRALDYVTFYLSAAWVLSRLTRRGDVVVAKTDPPMMSVVAGPIVRWRGARLVNWLQDIFPEVAEALGVGRGPVARLTYRLMRSLRNRSLQGAAINVALGARMAERIERLGVRPARIRIIANWTDAAQIRPLTHDANTLRWEWGLHSRFVVGYSGNLGRAHEYRTLLDAIALVESADNKVPVIWLFIGGGALLQAFKDGVERRGLRSVQFKPYQPRERLAESLSAADVHLVSLKPELEGLIVPSKVYGIAAVGRCTIFIGDEDGEIARLLAKHESGVSVRQGDGCGLARVVLALADDHQRVRRLGQNARRAAETEFDKSVAVARWELLLHDLRATNKA